MRFLVDNSLSPQLAARLTTLGHESIHLRDLNLESAPDEAVMENAVRTNRVLISADSDFARMLAEGRLVAPSVILLREGKPYEPARQLELLSGHFAEIEAAVSQRSVIVFKRGRMRIRRLPISGE